MNRHISTEMFQEENHIEYWDKLYDRNDFYGVSYRQRMNIVLSWLESLGLQKGSMILEAGCGAGRLACIEAKKGYSVFGVDFSLGMVIKACNHCSNSSCKNNNRPNLIFLQGDIEALPLKPENFDVVVCLGVISYLQSEEIALDSLFKVLKPGGTLAISIINKNRLVHRLDVPLLFMTIGKKIFHRAATFLKKSDRKKTNHSSIITYSIPKFQKSLEQAGFQVLEYRTVPHKILTFGGKEVYPPKLAERITFFFEQFTNVPLVGSFGGMCIFKAVKNSPGTIERSN